MRKLYLIIDDDGVVQGELPFHEHEILEREDIVDKDMIPIPEGMVVICGVTPKLVNGKWVECEVPVDIEKLKEEKRAELNEACRQSIIGGFEFEGSWFGYLPDPDQLNYNKYADLFRDEPDAIVPMRTQRREGYKEKTELFDKARFDLFKQRIEKHELPDNLMKVWALKDTLITVSTTEEIEALSWTSGE